METARDMHMMSLKTLTIASLFFTLVTTSGAEEQFYPEALLKLDKHFSHHVLIAEKSTHMLHLYQNLDGKPKFIKTFQVATGKKAGDKIFQGDFRTPEGIFHFTDFLTYDDLIARHGKAGEIYGVGAFVMNYPNPMDLRAGKTGGGIWLHSTNDETRIEKGLDSRGCVVAKNDHLVEISKYVELNRTPIIVTQDRKFLPKASWQTMRASLETFVETWRTSWQEENLKKYISHYHPKEFLDNHRGEYKQFRRYKKAVFWGPGKPKIQLKDISFIKSKEYVVATFKQGYQSNTINDVGRKNLYLKRDEYYQWKIVAETWSKAGLDVEGGEQVAFQPSMRFFKTQNSDEALEKGNN
jgi:murein L,D-transpeptidase YafK